jgi:HD-GYP domain-containing protein (c-di-GMP phosphodiesterase class II)
MNADKQNSALPEDVLLSVKLFSSFYKLLQIVRIHRDDNQLVIQCAKNFIEAVNLYGGDESLLTIQIVSGRFYLQKERLLYRRETSALINYAMAYFEKRRLHGLSFSTAIESKDLSQVLLFAHLLNQAETHQNPAEWLKAKINEKDWSWVEIIPQPDSEIFPTMEGSGSLTVTKDTMANIREEATVKSAEKAYAGSLVAMKEVIGKVSNNKPAGVRKAVRVVQKMVDLVFDERPVLLKLSTLRDYDDYTYTHSVNVMILAMCLGLHIGLSKEALETLGICGLFHDLGKVDVPLKILNKEGKLAEHEFEAIQKHSINSVRHIAKLKVSRDLKSKIMLAPFEHHLKYDLSGYPRSWRTEPVSLFGRILTIVDVFDAITSCRVYRPDSLSPDKALAMMHESAGKDFDPILLKAFINMLGIYPVGTMVRLDTGEIGLVMENPEKSDGDRPLVVVLNPEDGGRYSRGATVDLSEREALGGSYKRNIVRTYNPGLFGIQPAEYIV